MTTTKNNIAITKAVDLLIDNDTDLSNFFKEGGLATDQTSCGKGFTVRNEQIHLGYDRYDCVITSNNARNGISQKNLITDNGLITIDVPRDREAQFEPAITPNDKQKLTV